ncbi:MAG TPA: DUF4235 domain-containing protein [Longimicrobiales bacterium]|nr:DUF4235 domain-containing protein [Longimicrobiales bacterium]
MSLEDGPGLVGRAEGGVGGAWYGRHGPRVATGTGRENSRAGQNAPAALPPENPAARSVDWSEAIAWTVATGVVVGLMRPVAERSAATGWRKVKGRYPKGLE